jgi:hypothetical protein
VPFPRHTPQAGATAATDGGDEFPQNPEVDDAAAYAVQQLSSQSNSLFPLALKKVQVAMGCLRECNPAFQECSTALFRAAASLPCWW